MTPNFGREYQDDAFAWLTSEHRPKLGGVLSMEMGLGKTVVAAPAFEANDWSTVLAAVPKNAFPAFRRILPIWLGTDRVEFRTITSHRIKDRSIKLTAADRHRYWDALRNDKLDHSKIQVFLTTPSIVHRDQKVIPWNKFANITVDEYSRSGLKNRKSAFFDIIKQYTRHTPKLFLDGTPVSKGVPDWFGPFHLIDRKNFPHYWPFVSKYVDFVHNGFGYEVAGYKNLEEFHALRDRYAFIRTKKEVGWKASTREILPIELGAEQQKLYDSLAKEMYHYDPVTGALILASNDLDKYLKCRMAAICPKVLDSSLPYGAYIEEIAERIIANELTHSVIFCPYKAPLYLFQDYLKGLLPKAPIYILHGGLDVDLQDVMDRYKARGGIVLCTIDFAQSFDLDPATCTFFAGGLNNPNANRQAEARIQRAPDLGPFNHYYLAALGTPEFDFEETVNIRQMHVNIAMGRSING
jgi:hypothetical protein